MLPVSSLSSVLLFILVNRHTPFHSNPFQSIPLAQTQYRSRGFPLSRSRHCSFSRYLTLMSTQADEAAAAATSDIILPWESVEDAFSRLWFSRVVNESNPQYRIALHTLALACETLDASAANVSGNIAGATALVLCIQPHVQLRPRLIEKLLRLFTRVRCWHTRAHVPCATLLTTCRHRPDHDASRPLGRVVDALRQGHLAPAFLHCAPRAS